MTLIGGGWDPLIAADLYAPFAEAVLDRGGRLVCLLQEGVDPRRWVKHLGGFGLSDVSVVDVCPDRGVPMRVIEESHGVLVCGGRNPLYQRSLVALTRGMAGHLRDQQVPYLGFSAGAAVGGRFAVCGGHETHHPGQARPSPVALPKFNEGLTDLALRPGLDLAPFAIDVHATQSGTLPRLMHAVAAGICSEGWSLDADAALHLDTDTGKVAIAGAASIYRIRPDGVASAYAAGALRRVMVDILTPGTTLTIDQEA